MWRTNLVIFGVDTVESRMNNRLNGVKVFQDLLGLVEILSCSI